MNVSKVLRDVLVCELQKQNNFLRKNHSNNTYGMKVRVIEHVTDPSGNIQEETEGYLYNIESCRAYVFIKKNDQVKIISCSLRKLIFLDEKVLNLFN